MLTQPIISQLIKHKIVVKKNTLLKPIACLTSGLILLQTLLPSVALALTGGPSQPEMESFEPVGTTDMVDLFTGDFNYNIPLVDVGGYPLNIAYHSGVGMDQEASWVGLGWNINVGSITRQMRGLPDDFDGSEEVKKTTHIEPDKTWALFADLGLEILGIGKKDDAARKNADTVWSVTPSVKFGITKNNYRGLGFTLGADFAISQSIKKPGTTGDNRPEKAKSLSLGFGASSTDGFEYDANYSSSNYKGKSFGIGTGISSRGGLKNIVLSWNLRMKWANFKPKNKKSEGSISGGGGNRAIPMGPIPNLTETQNSFHTSVQNYDIKASFPIWGTSAHASLTGTFSSTSITDGEASFHPIGYMYAQNKASVANSIQDFARDKEKPLSKSSKFLSPSSPTYDVFSLSGQGTGGMFRPHRYQMGVFSNPDHYIDAVNVGNLGAELGFGGGSFKLGLSYTPSFASERSGHWSGENGNDISTYNFNGRYGIKKEFAEPFHFQFGGEFVPVNKTYLKRLGGDKAVRLNISHSFPDVYGTIKAFLSDVDSSAFYMIDSAITERAPRVAVISMLTADEASRFGWMPSLKSFVINSFKQSTSDTYTSVSRTTQHGGHAHHIGEITQLKEDGSRYIYAIPAYNTSMEEAMFNSNGSVNLNKGLINYKIEGEANENSTNNSVGMDHYYSQTLTPGYAHSYLLTSVLSANYVDADLDGKPSEGDIGDYVVFNYTRVNGDYKWRVPVEENQAHYIEGLRSDPTDNKAAYTYGSKEIWMLHSIQTRTHYASFSISKRDDALGVKGPNGGKDDTQANYKLDTIALFSLNDRVVNGNKATPVKKIVFEYDYSLCPQIPNNKNFNLANIGVTKTGKLTLKKLYILFGKSSKGAMSPYTFDYGYNPSYNMACYDRWGNYKPNNEALNNKDYPYVDQYLNKDSIDAYASAWSLNKINLPSGGTIKIKLESDDYAFVQDQKASNMIQIVGATTFEELGNFSDKNNNDVLYNNKGKRCNYLVFKLPPSITTADELKNKCFSKIVQLYFKFLVVIAGKEEYVSGWVEIDRDQIGITGNDGAYYGYVKVKEVKQGDRIMNRDNPVNAIAKTSWQFATMNMSKFLHPGSQNNGSGSAAFQALMDSWGEGIDMFRGQYQALKLREVASKFHPKKSWIRIESADLKKFGGGARVKELTFEDSWNEMDESDKTSSYTQEYDYTIRDEKMAVFGYNIISSGVTTFEPSVGAEENSLKNPYNTREESTNVTLPATVLYDEGPIGESYYPGPNVGYSSVTVKNKTKAGVNRTGTGKTIHEFYTARDFPVRVDYSDQKVVQFGNDLFTGGLNSLLKVSINEFHASSQGFAFIINDMHGKPKAVTTYAETLDDTFLSPISKVTYTYQTVNGVLDNHVRVLNEDGTIENVEIAKTVDVGIDLRENERKEINAGFELNIETDFAGPLPFIWGFPVPKFRYALKRQQAASFTKIIQQYGVLKSTTVQDEGSLITTSNLLYDKVTGGVLLTETKNGFDDPIYNFNYPAHMAYDGMGPAYKNIHLIQSVTLNSNSKCTVNKNNFFVGDLVMLESGGYSLPGHVVDKISVTDTTEEIKVIRLTGLNYYAGNYTMKVIESGRKNMLTESVGKLMLNKNPIVGSQLSIDSLFVIDASANTFNDFWPTRYLTRNSISTSTSCEIVADTFMVQTFIAMLQAIKKYRIDSVHSNPYRLDSLSWFYNSALYRKRTSSTGGTYYTHNNYLRFGNPRLAGTEFLYGGDTVPISYWADNDSIIVGLVNDTTVYGTSRVHSFRMWNLNGCLLSSIDTFLNVIPNTAVNNYTEGIAVALMTNGDTCDFYFYPQSGIYDGASFINTNCVTNEVCQYEARRLFDPYTKGLRGQWRPYENFAFNNGRKYYHQNDTTFIRKDGVYEAFTPLWKFNNSGLYKYQTKNWVAASKITNYSSTGKPIESVDALGNYTSEVYGYNDNLVVAAASNAKVSDIGNDNFESYNSILSQCNNTQHWSFMNGKVNLVNPFYKLNSSDINSPDSMRYTVSITSSTSHSGMQSLMVNKGNSITVSTLIDTSLINKHAFYGNGYEENNVANYLTQFRPVGSKKMLIGAWVRGKYNNINTTNSFDSAYVVVKCFNGDKSSTLLNVKVKAKGPIIEGWQRIEGVFTIPDSSAFLDVTLENIGTNRAYFDDIRIHPFESNMKTFVYDPILLKVMSTLDENNFATFYEYDGEGKLVRVKRETTRGVMTIQESRRGINKTLNP